MTSALSCAVWRPVAADRKLGLTATAGRAAKPRAPIRVGSRKIAVDWNLLYFEPGHQHKVMLALDRREIAGAPKYKADAASAQMVGPPLIGPSTDAAVEPPGD